MSDLPNWIETRIDRNLDNTLTQEHVVETMLASERPFFSVRQIQARLKPDVSKATVRNRLNELEEIDVVATETYPESVTLYYINYQESNWPLSPEGKRALTTEHPRDRLSIGGRRISGTVGGRRLAVVGLLAVLGSSAVASVVGLGLLLGVGDIATTVGLVLAGCGIALLSVTVEVAFFGVVLFAADRIVG